MSILHCTFTQRSTTIGGLPLESGRMAIQPLDLIKQTSKFKYVLDFALRLTKKIKQV